MPQTPNFNTIILLRGFSTYSDRKIFFYSSYTDYVNKAINSYNQYNINFNPNDGIDAVVDLSSLATDFSEAEDIHTFSYLLVLDPSTNDIVSRWYIMDAVRQTNGIYRFTLKRDVVAESIGHEDFVNRAPIYVEKAILNDDDPMVVNSEGMQFNQIKKGEKLLKETSFACIVGYMENSSFVDQFSVQDVAFTPDAYLTATDIVNVTGLDAASVDALLGNNSISVVTSDLSLVFGISKADLELLMSYKIETIIPNSFSGDTKSYFSYAPGSWSGAVGSASDGGEAQTIGVAFANEVENNYNALLTDINTILNNITPGDKYIKKSTIDALDDLVGRYVSYSGQYYLIEAVNRGGVSPHEEVNIDEGQSTTLDDIIDDIPYFSRRFEDWRMFLNYQTTSISLQLKLVEPYTFKVKVSSSHNNLKDAPYSMFVIPYGTYGFRTNASSGVVTWSSLSEEQALNIAFKIAEKLGTKLYDLQLLPYIPEFGKWVATTVNGIPIVYHPGNKNVLYTKNKTNEEDYNYILDSNDSNVGLIIYPKISSFSRSFKINWNYRTVQDEPKIESQCNFYRLCSPNYNGVFEFNLAKTRESLTNINFDCTYKPYIPFIRITPDFGFLYGQNYKDGRGLICGGDFSLPYMSDAWVNYQNNNKNFANIFARDIQNLDFTQKQERFKEPFNLMPGVVGGGVAGAVAGSKGGPYGAIAGAAVGLGAGIAGGAIDARLAEERRAETKDYAIDRFNFSLKNIQAIPDSLAKNSAFNVVSKIYPFVEYYSCTDEEKAALRNKIKYDGMTVGRIGELFSYMGGNDNPKYFKGQLIRAEGITEDDHFVRTLYNELAKGVYI